MFARNVSIVLVTNVAKTVLGMAGSIALVRTYGLSLIGEIALVTGMAGLATLVSDLGFSAAYTKFLAEDPKGQGRYLGSYALIKALLYLLFLAGAAYAFRYSSADPALYLACLFSFLLMPFSDTISTSLIGLRRFSTLSYLELSAKLATFLATLSLCGPWQSKYAVAALPAIEIVIKSAYLLITLAWSGSISISGPERSILRRYWTFTKPIMFSQAVSTSLNYIDRILLGRLVGVTELGFYTVALRVYQGMDVLVRPLTSNLFPEVAARMRQNSDFLATGFKDVLAVLSAFGALLVLSSLFLAEPLVTAFYGPDAAPAAPIIWAFSMVILCKLFFRPYHHLMLITENHALMSYLGILNLPISILGYLLLIPLSVGGSPLAGAAIPLTECLLWLFPTGAYVLSFLRRRGMPTHLGWLALRIYLPLAGCAALGIWAGFQWVWFPPILIFFLVIEYKAGVLTEYRFRYIISPLAGLARFLPRKKSVPESSSP